MEQADGLHNLPLNKKTKIKRDERKNEKQDWFSSVFDSAIIDVRGDSSSCSSELGNQ